MPRIAVYPGSFDPITNGHEEIVRKASKLFDIVYVVVCVNPKKLISAFTVDERVAMLEATCKKYPNVKIDRHYGIAVEYAANKGAIALIRGVRNPQDFENEITQYYFNHNMEPDIETVVLLPDVTSLYISSSWVRELAMFDADFKPYVPAESYDTIRNKLCKK